jgi:hypothetical protein
LSIKKLYSYKSSRQVWRILVSGSDKLLIETRDVSTKDVYYNCFVLESGEKLFTDLQLEEKYWLGVEAFEEDVILFHTFPKPDMPQHRGITAFNVLLQKVLWQNNEYSYLFQMEGKVYGFQQGFEEKHFAAFDLTSGKLIEDFGNDFKKINSLRAEADSKKNWDVYIFPQILSDDENNPRIRNIISEQIKNIDIDGEVEYNIAGNILLFNYHIKNSDGSFTNKFSAVDIQNGSVVLSEILNENIKSLLADSFFVFKNYLFLLRGKDEVLVYGME